MPNGPPTAPTAAPVTAEFSGSDPAPPAPPDTPTRIPPARAEAGKPQDRMAEITRTLTVLRAETAIATSLSGSRLPGISDTSRPAAWGPARWCDRIARRRTHQTPPPREPAPRSGAPPG